MTGMNTTYLNIPDHSCDCPVIIVNDVNRDGCSWPWLVILYQVLGPLALQPPRGFRCVMFLTSGFQLLLSLKPLALAVDIRVQLACKRNFSDSFQSWPLKTYPVNTVVLERNIFFLQILWDFKAVGPLGSCRQMTEEGKAVEQCRVED